MGLVNGKWKVVKGDCLWNIAKSVYKNAYKWKDIANANGIKQSNPVIYPGQLLKLPGVTSTTSSTPKPTTGKSVTIQWFALDADTERDMFATWSYDRKNTDHYEVRWDYDTGAGGWRIGNHSTTTDKQSAYSAPDSAKKVRLQIKPIAKTHTVNNKEVYYWTDGAWVTKEYDFSNNPPKLPPSPTIEIEELKLTATIENIDTTINGDTIEFAVYKNDTNKFKTGTAKINFDSRFVKFTCDVDPGAEYKVRCRAVRGTIYGGWTDFTSNAPSIPAAPKSITTLRPQVISEQAAKQYGVFIEWDEVKTAKTYEVQWTTDISYFDISGEPSSQTTTEGEGPRLLITDIELGHEYFFRVRARNDKGDSGWSPIKSTTLGTRPAAPTTWSNTSICVVGESLNLYWTHNSTDGSIESIARLHLTLINSALPSSEPMEITKVINNDRPEEDKTKTSVYTIDTTSDEWALLQQGFVIKWKVQTAGVIEEYSEWSVEREINVYAKPELEIDIKNQNGESVSEINSFPFYVSVLAKPATQIPISYYLEIIANEGYETVDSVGKVNVINPGDKVYQKYFDPETNAWEFMAMMTPANIDLENGVSYTVNCTVSMNSGLSASSSIDFGVSWDEIFYDVFADVTLNKETLEASIHPYCNEYTEVDGEIVPVLTENCTLSVYRREYNGTFTEIATGINNSENTYVTDPHPALDYARYRIVAKTNDTGAISYCDLPAVYFGEPSVVIQWSEEWSNFEVNEDGEGAVEPTWAGSMVKIPYNIDVSESKTIDVSLINYVGRQHPVSYYGTHIGETANWKVEIPKEDKELIYALRRLSVWTGDVYVREPSGTGYWANISVSLDISHSNLTVPVTFDIRRVEGGM